MVAASPFQPAQLDEGEAMQAEILAEIAWRDANVDNADPVLRAMARAPLADEPMAADVRLELGAAAELRTGSAQGIPHDEIERELDQRRRAATAT
jgi:hypothetical protein